MDSTKPPMGRRVMTGLSRTLVTLIVLGLVGLVAWLASERNARTFSLRVEDGKLVVLKGRMLPMGAEPWAPGDPLLADAYAPIPLEGARPDAALLQTTYSDRDELDRALFRQLEELARQRIHSEDEQTLEQGLYYLRRAQRLTGISQEQRLTLEQMQADVAYYQAKSKLEQARRIIADAVAQLELAAEAQGPNAERSRQMAAAITGPARALEQALRDTARAAPAQPGQEHAPVPEPATTPDAGTAPSTAEPPTAPPGLPTP
ncbi:MAG: IF-2 protein [Myxococcaceae bacterium]